MSKKKEAMDFLTALGVGAAGAVVSSWIVNFIPGVKDAKPVTRSLAQLAVGGSAVFVPGKYRLARYALLGVAYAGTLGAVERATGMKTLAGAGGSLTARELAALRSLGAMHGPVTMRSLAGPATMTPQMDGRPSMMGAGGFKAPA